MNELKMGKMLECTTTETKFWRTNNCEMKLLLLTSLIIFFQSCINLNYRIWNSDQESGPAFTEKLKEMVLSLFLNPEDNNTWHWEQPDGFEFKWRLGVDACGSFCSKFLQHWNSIFLSFLFVLSRVVYIRYVFTRGYQTHSITNTLRDKKKNIPKHFFLALWGNS